MDEDFPCTLEEFRERFDSEAACIAYMVMLRWPDGFSCPRCGFNQGWSMSRGLILCRGCRYQISVTAGTIFHRSRKPLRLWFEAMWHITSQKYGANALGLQRVLGLGSYNTAWRWLHRLRRAMVRPGREKLTGTIEIDETYIGGKKPGKRGRGAENKALVAIAVEDTAHETTKGIGRIRLARIPDASGNSLLPFIQQNVGTGSLVRTDGWTGYAGVTKVGYEHLRVSSKQLIISHLSISLLKRWLLGTYQGAVQAHQLDYYLDEFTFRFNRRTSASRGKLFYRLVQQAVATGPIPGAEIVGGGSLDAMLPLHQGEVGDDLES